MYNQAHCVAHVARCRECAVACLVSQHPGTQHMIKINAGSASWMSVQACSLRVHGTNQSPVAMVPWTAAYLRMRFVLLRFSFWQTGWTGVAWLDILASRQGAGNDSRNPCPKSQDRSLAGWQNYTSEHESAKGHLCHEESE